MMLFRACDCSYFPCRHNPGKTNNGYQPTEVKDVMKKIDPFLVLMVIWLGICILYWMHK